MSHAILNMVWPKYLLQYSCHWPEGSMFFLWHKGKCSEAPEFKPFSAPLSGASLTSVLPLQSQSYTVTENLQKILSLAS